MNIVKVVDNMNEQLETLYEALDDKSITKHEKKAILGAIDELESEITEITGSWNDETSLYFENGKKV